VIIGGVWVLGLGDSSPEIRKIKAFMRIKFASYCGNLADTELYDQQMVAAVTEMQRRYGLPPGPFTGTIGYSTKVLMGYLKKTPPVLFTFNGASVDMWTGYQSDLARALPPGLVTWQPVGYDSKPFPMAGGLAGGTAETVRLLTDVTAHPTGPFIFLAYSEGAIIASNVYDMLRDPNSAIGHRRKDFLGAATWGNPRRENGHTFPGGIPIDGEGIVAPTLKNTEAFWWDMANGKEIPGSQGEDLYTTMSGATGKEAEYMRDIWGFVYNVWDGVSDLTVDIFQLLGNPVGLGIPAVKALLAATAFFGGGLKPHGDYQSSFPIRNDPRDAWRIAFDHIVQLAQ
jgi:hypothetical protein